MPLRQITLTLSLLLLLVEPGATTTYYVATTGSDSNPGTQTAPFASMARGITVLHAGDTLYVRAGTYPGYDINRPFPSGTSWSQAITVAGYPGETVVVPGLGMASQT